jgi:hypothetical protein
MRTVEKVSVALSTEDLEWARRKAENDGESLSAVLSAALKRARQAEARGRLLKLLGAGDIPASVLDEVRNELYAGR